jgi:hypothetical protein
MTSPPIAATNQEYMEALPWAYDNGYVTVVSNVVQDNLDGSTEVLLELDRQGGTTRMGPKATDCLRKQNGNMRRNGW